MKSLIGFEFKKIVTRKPAYLSALVVVVLLITVYLMNVNSNIWYDDENNTVSGFDAIALHQEYADALAGTVTNERITEEFREYRSFFDAEGELKEEYSTPSGTTVDYASYGNSHAYYFSTFLEPWMNGSENPSSVIPRVDTSSEVDLYAAIDQKLENKLDAGMRGTWDYSSSERAYWNNLQNQVNTPYEYGYHGGWATILDCFEFLILVFIAICVGLTPVFAAEYKEKTDAIILATKYGKTKLVSAKVIASLLYTLAMMAIGLLLLIGLPLLFYGAGGAELPVQLASVVIAYPLSFIQSVALLSGLAVLVALGLAAFTLFLSARWKSTLGIIMVCVAVLLLPVFLPLMNNGLLAHIAVLFPVMSISFANLFKVMISYPLSTFVVDAQTMVAVVYCVVVVVMIPLAMRAFKRHQVQ